MMNRLPTSSVSEPLGTALEPQFDVLVNGDVRKGSPFAAGSAIAQPGSVRWVNSQTVVAESIGQGVWQETATSAVFASWLLLGFAIAAWMWFPAGGMAITLLGMTMSLLGFSSNYKKLSTVGLVTHGVILTSCYFQTL